MMKFIKGLFVNKKFDLDNDGKVESYREEIKGVFSQFKRMSENLVDVNEKLTAVIEDEKFAKECEQDNIQRLIEASQKKQAKSDSIIESANKEIEVNKKLQEKVKEFIAE